MENYHLNGTNKTPELLIDYDNRIVKLAGRCLVEEAYIFFFQLLEVITDLDDIKFIVDLEYMNSSSLRHLFALIRDELRLREVVWTFEEDDFDMKEKGDYFQEMVNDKHPNVIFTIIEKPR